MKDQWNMIFDKEWGRGLDLRSGHLPEGSSNANVAIKFKDERKGEGFWNARLLSIRINDPKLRTPEMAAALDHLRDFHERRQARLAAAADVSAEPA